MAGQAQAATPLPTGWEMRLASDGRPYFLDHRHGSTHWVDPRLPGVRPDLGPLPAGWAYDQDTQGKVYFRNFGLGAVTWDDPRLYSFTEQKYAQSNCPSNETSLTRTTDASQSSRASASTNTVVSFPSFVDTEAVQRLNFY